VEISENDLWILSYYRESELAGGLVMGRLARETDDDDLRVHLTEHCAEEAHHAWLWTETILKVGGTPKRVAETYQTRYYAEIGMPASLLEILTLTQVFERRVIRHFRAHLKWPDVHPVVAETMRRFTEVDERVYEAAMRYRDNARDLLDPALRGNGQARLQPKLVAPVAGSPTSTTNAELRRLVAKSLGVSQEIILDASSLRDLGVNSLDLVVLVMSIEEHFHIEFEPSDLERLRTFADLARRVGELTASR